MNDAGSQRERLAALERAVKPTLPRRFYSEASFRSEGKSFVLTLDERPARTPGRRPMALPTRAAAVAVAAEWQAQTDVIDPSQMPLTRIVNAAIDGVAAEMPVVAAEIVKYAGSDLVCYRAEGPEALVASQAEAWDPVLGWAQDALGARFFLAEGVMFQPQPPRALAAIQRAVDDVGEPIALASLHVMTTLSGSALLALAAFQGVLSAEDAWARAHVDEAHQERLWGEDEEALVRRQRRGEDFAAAARLSQLVRDPTV